MNIYKVKDRKKIFEEERRRLNLQLLRRHDESINEIVAHSSFVSVYVMDPNSQKWTRGDIEGFLHIVKRDIEPKYQLIVLNQKNPENLIIGISDEWEISAETHFLFYKIPNNKNSIVSCLWFYDVEERKFIETELKRIISKLTELNMKNNAKYLQPTSSSSSIFKPDQEIFYNDNARKTILGFLNKNMTLNKDGILNDTLGVKTNTDEDINKNFNNINICSGIKNEGDVINGNGFDELPSDPLKKLLHFQGILGGKRGSDTNNMTIPKMESKSISPEEITDAIMEVLSSKEVYDMILNRINDMINS